MSVSESETMLLLCCIRTELKAMCLETYTGRVLLEFLDKHVNGNPFFYMKLGWMKDEPRSFWGQKFNNPAHLHGRLTRLDSAAPKTSAGIFCYAFFQYCFLY